MLILYVSMHIYIYTYIVCVCSTLRNIICDVSYVSYVKNNMHVKYPIL